MLQATLSIPLRRVLRQARSEPGLAASLAEIFDEIRKEPVPEKHYAIREGCNRGGVEPAA